jgi:hypothetical protein
MYLGEKMKYGKDTLEKIVVILFSAIIIASSSVVVANINEKKLFVSAESSTIIRNLPIDEDEIKYYNPNTLTHVIGLSGGTPPYYWYSAIRLSQDELAPYTGWILIKVKVALSCEFQNEVNATLTIWGEGTSTNPGSVIYEDDNLSFNTTGFHFIDLNGSIALDDHEEIWIGIEWEQKADFNYIPFADDGPAVDEKGDWVNMGNGWQELQELGNPPLDYNWGMGGIISNEGGELIVDAGGPYKQHVNETVNFQGSAIGGNPPYKYNWSFGDGNNSDEQNPSHVYTRIGIYNVTLNVTDSSGNYSIDNTTATIVKEGEDIIPPETNCTLIGEKFGDIYIGKVTVNLIAIDNENGSGVNHTMYKINNGPYQIYTEPFNVLSEGNHTIHFYSVDNNSNKEDEKSCSFRIKNLAELEIEINRFRFIIKNIGNFNATNVVWSLDIKGGIFGLNDRHFEGEKDNLTIDQTINQRIPVLFGLGRIEFVAIADASNAKEEVIEVERGLLVLFFILGF